MLIHLKIVSCTFNFQRFFQFHFILALQKKSRLIIMLEIGVYWERDIGDRLYYFFLTLVTGASFSFLYRLERCSDWLVKLRHHLF